MGSAGQRRQQGGWRRGRSLQRAGRQPGLAEREAGVAAVDMLRPQHAQAGGFELLRQRLAQHAVVPAAAAEHDAADLARLRQRDAAAGQRAGQPEMKGRRQLAARLGQGGRSGAGLIESCQPARQQRQRVERWRVTLRAGRRRDQLGQLCGRVSG